MRRATTALALVLGATLWGDPARAGELPEAIRRMAERAFLVGRLDDVDEILAGAEEASDRLPLVVRDEWWRATWPRPERPPLVPGDSLTARRLAWLREQAPTAPWPMPVSVGEDPYPILSALVADRVHRETRGHEGLPTHGPLAALAKRLDPRREKRAIWFLDAGGGRMMSIAYRGPPPYPDQVEADRKAEALRARNGLWAIVVLLAFLVVAALGGALVRVRGEP